MTLRSNFLQFLLSALTLILIGCQTNLPQDQNLQFSKEELKHLSACGDLDKILTSNVRSFSGISAGGGYVVEGGVKTSIEYKHLESSAINTLTIVSTVCRQRALNKLPLENYEKILLSALAPQELFEALIPHFLKGVVGIEYTSEIKNVANIDPNKTAVKNPSESEIVPAMETQVALASMAQVSISSNTFKFALSNFNSPLNIIKFITNPSTEQDIIGTPIIVEFSSGNVDLDKDALLILNTEIPNYERGRSLTISGYADHNGSNERNLLLSQLRAVRVKEWIIANKNYPSAVIKDVTGYGSGLIGRRIVKTTLYQDSKLKK